MCSVNDLFCSVLLKLFVMMSSFPCRVEFDRLTDLLRQRTIESNLPTSMISHKEKNEGCTRTNEPGGSTSHRMAADYSAPVKVRTKPSHSSILCYS
jgi:hypothetical protein